MTTTSSPRRLAFALAIAAASVLATPAAAFARGGGGGGSTGGTGGGSGSCSVTPNPVAKYATYTVNGSGLPAGQIVSVFVRDSGGTSWTSVQVDSSGHASVTGQDAYTGTSSVTISMSSGKQTTQLASCSFQVV